MRLFAPNCHLITTLWYGMSKKRVVLTLNIHELEKESSLVLQLTTMMFLIIFWNFFLHPVSITIIFRFHNEKRYEKVFFALKFFHTILVFEETFFFCRGCVCGSYVFKNSSRGILNFFRKPIWDISMKNNLEAQKNTLK